MTSANSTKVAFERPSADAAQVRVQTLVPIRAQNVAPAKSLIAKTSFAQPAPAPRPAISAAVVVDPVTYTSDDRSVIEPVLFKPYLPLKAGPGVTDDKLGVLELVIDTRGLVESVHLKSPGNRYRERWWVFAAKAWEFRPALKDGVPVRFLKRIALTDLNLADLQ